MTTVRRKKTTGVACICVWEMSQWTWLKDEIATGTEEGQEGAHLNSELVQMEEKIEGIN